MFSRKFIDSQESNTSIAGLMNLHNNEAGRRVIVILIFEDRISFGVFIFSSYEYHLQAIRSRMQRVCKCHGMSGSCSVRVCWRRLPSIRSVGEALGQLYDGASYVKVSFFLQKKENLYGHLGRHPPDSVGFHIVLQRFFFSKASS